FTHEDEDPRRLLMGASGCVSTGFPPSNNQLSRAAPGLDARCYRRAEGWWKSRASARADRQISKRWKLYFSRSGSTSPLTELRLGQRGPESSATRLTGWSAWHTLTSDDLKE